MTQQQEKAREIVIKMQFQKEPLMFEQAKQCALIEVNEIIEELIECSEVWMKSRIKYWQEVQQEIELL